MTAPLTFLTCALFLAAVQTVGELEGVRAGHRDVVRQGSGGQTRGARSRIVGCAFQRWDDRCLPAGR